MPTVAHDHDAVGEVDHLGHVARDEQHGQSLARQLPDELMQVALGADVDAHGGLVDDEDVHPGGEPLGQAHLLLVAAAQAARRRWTAMAP